MIEYQIKVTRTLKETVTLRVDRNGMLENVLEHTATRFDHEDLLAENARNCYLVFFHKELITTILYRIFRKGEQKPQSSKTFENGESNKE